MGRDRGDLPVESASARPLHDDRLKLAPQLGDRLLHALPGQPWRRQRKSRQQGLLPLGRLLRDLHRVRVLLHLRDQGPQSRTGRRTLRQGMLRSRVKRPVETENAADECHSAHKRGSRNTSCLPCASRISRRKTRAWQDAARWPSWSRAPCGERAVPVCRARR